jgi:hypothetical protein
VGRFSNRRHREFATSALAEQRERGLRQEDRAVADLVAGRDSRAARQIDSADE